MMPNIHTIIRQHVSLEVRCIDRIYVQGYMPEAPDLWRPVLLPARLPPLPGAVPGPSETPP